jgi:hypothetical protein
MIEDFHAMFSPPPGEEEGYARTLLQAAGDQPWKIHSTMDGPTGLAFLVYDELVAEKANRLLFPAEDPDEILDREQEAFEQAVPKRRGRPPKKKSEAPAEDNGNAAEELS